MVKTVAGGKGFAGSYNSQNFQIHDYFILGHNDIDTKFAYKRVERSANL
jgi:hypothetical protein